MYVRPCSSRVCSNTLPYDGRDDAIFSPVGAYMYAYELMYQLEGMVSQAQCRLDETWRLLKRQMYALLFCYIIVKLRLYLCPSVGASVTRRVSTGCRMEANARLLRRTATISTCLLALPGLITLVYSGAAYRVALITALLFVMVWP